MYKVVKRDGQIAEFQIGKITAAITKAFEALNKQYPWIAVEQVLDEAFITALPADKQEICNQINRRTEFKVVKTTYKLF